MPDTLPYIRYPISSIDEEVFPSILAIISGIQHYALKFIFRTDNSNKGNSNSNDLQLQIPRIINNNSSAAGSSSSSSSTVISSKKSLILPINFPLLKCIINSIFSRIKSLFENNLQISQYEELLKAKKQFVYVLILLQKSILPVDGHVSLF